MYETEAKHVHEDLYNEKVSLDFRNTQKNQNITNMQIT